MSIYYLNKEEKYLFETLKQIKLSKEEREQVTACCSGVYNANYGNPQSEYQKEKQSDLMKGYTIVKTSTGEFLKVKVDDPRYLSGELVGIASGKIAVKDIHGNNLLVDKNDPRYLSGELVGVQRGKKFKQKVPSPHKGTFLAKNREGHMVRLTKSDPRYISGEYIHFRSKF